VYFCLVRRSPGPHDTAVLRNGLRDLRWRWRRFVVALGGAALVFACTLLMVGLTNSFDEEIRDSLNAVDADTWIVSSGAGGPFTSFRFVPEFQADQIERSRGVERADPFVFSRQTVRTADGLVDANVFGHRIGGLGAPPVVKGRAVRASGEIVVDESLGVPIGGTVRLGNQPFNVVGLGDGLTLYAGSPNLYLPLRDAQVLLLFGQRLANVIVSKGAPADLPDNLTVMTSEEVATDVLRPLGKPVGAIRFAQQILWVVAAFVIGAVVYTSALERARDFAVFKATGISSGYVLGGLAIQAVVLSVAAALLSIGIARILAPLFPMRVLLSFDAFPLLFAEAIGVGIVASLFGARRAVSADPALAFAGP
jgi:putative ABC transport system permease protein